MEGDNLLFCTYRGRFSSAHVFHVQLVTNVKIVVGRVGS